MSTGSIAVRFASLVVVLIAGRAAPGGAGEGHRKPQENHPNKGMQAAAAAEHRAMMQQQRAVIQNQMANQHRLMLQNQAVNQNRAVTNGSATHLNHHAGVGGGHRGGSGTGQSHQNQSGAMIASLHSAVARLNQADHDYNGHRVQAIRQLDQAIRTLHGGHPASTASNAGRNGSAGTFGGTGTGTGLTAGRGTGQGFGSGVGGGLRMSQAQSDGHLHQAHQELMSLEARMSNGSTGSPTNHQQAHTHVQQAIQHLNVALASR